MENAGMSESPANFLEQARRGLRLRLAAGLARAPGVRGRGASRRAGLPDKALLCVLAVALALVFLLSLLLGRYAVTPGEALRALMSWTRPFAGSVSPDVATIILCVRLPRVAADMLVGAALSTSGAAFQGIFKNPLVSPDILGVSTGAGLGAAMAILFSLGPFGVQAMAFGFGLLAVTATYCLGSWRAKAGEAVLVLILSGMIIGTVFSACISLIKYTADPYNILPAITFWLLGSLASVGASDVALAAVPILGGLTVVNLLRWNLNVLSFGDEEALSLGVDVRRVRLAVIAAATLMTASAVAISGVVGLVGLVVPHLARLVVGPNYRVLLPACVLSGAMFLLIVDDLARTLFMAEMPLGILTSLIGAPFFVYLLSNLRRGWGGRS
jgi:iron complex transport system permease protein